MLRAIALSGDADDGHNEMPEYIVCIGQVDPSEHWTTHGLRERMSKRDEFSLLSATGRPGVHRSVGRSVTMPDAAESYYRVSSCRRTHLNDSAAAD